MLRVKVGDKVKLNYKGERCGYRIVVPDKVYTVIRVAGDHQLQLVGADGVWYSPENFCLVEETMKLFGQLTREEKLKLMAAWVDGKTIQFNSNSGSGWGRIGHPTWLSDCEYRIALEKDYIDWSHVSPEFKFLARDADGTSFLYSHRPEKGIEHWCFKEGVGVKLKGFASYKKGTIEWDESLLAR